MAVSADGKTLATGGWDKTVRLWRVSDGAQVRAFAHPSPVNAVLFSRDGATLISGAHDGIIRLWDAATGAALGTLEGHELGIARLVLSATGPGCCRRAWIAPCASGTWRGGGR